MKPGKELHAAREPSVGHPRSMLTVRTTGKNTLQALVTSWKTWNGTLFTT